MEADAVDVSIILTSYNYARFLKRSIDSARAQRGSLEIVIVDNASTDDSWQIIEQNAAEDPRIRAYRNDVNIGMVPNHNRGLDLARGRRVLFLSADDVLLPGHVSRLLAAHEQHPDVDVFYTSYFKIDEQDNVIQFFGHIGHLRGQYFGGRNEFANLLTYDCYMCTPTMLFPREAMRAGGGFDEGLIAGDLELCLRLAAQGKKFGFLQTPGACIRLHAHEITGEENYVSTGKQLRDHLYLLDKYLTPEHRRFITGHEHGIARLLNAKINNVRAYPDTAARVMPEFQPQIDDAAKRLNAFVESTQKPIAAKPSISVVLICSDDVQAAIERIEMIGAQHYPATEIVLVVDAQHDISPVLVQRAKDVEVKCVVHRVPQSPAASLNDALRMASGDIFTYAGDGVRWPQKHLERIAAAFTSAQLDVLVVPADLVLHNGGKTVVRRPNYFGAPRLGDGLPLGESVPLFTISHRRKVSDASGGVDERRPYVSEFEFVRRLLSASAKTGVDATAPVTAMRSVDAIHPALRDAQGYVQALQASYAPFGGDSAFAARAQKHVQRIAAAFERASRIGAGGGYFDFWDAAADAPVEPLRVRRGGGRPTILMIDDRVPYRELGRGYPRARDIIEIVRDFADVTFYPLLTSLDSAPLDSGISGVDVLYGRGLHMLSATLEALLAQIDILWVSRPHNMQFVRTALGGSIPRDRNWRLIYDAEALYALRDIAKAQLAGNPPNAQMQRQMIAREASLLQECDAVFAVSENERRLLLELCKCPIDILSFCLEPTPGTKEFSERSGLLFVGAIEADSPNEDALAWFAANVSPLLESAGVAIALRHAGVMTSERLRKQAGAAVQFLGPVERLRSAYDSARIFIAPTRFAAGLPQKVYEAAANGLPVIVSPLLAQQLNWQHEVQCLVADTPDEWSQAIRRLHGDEQLWQQLRDRALEAVCADVSPAVFSERIRGTIQRLAGAAIA